MKREDIEKAGVAGLIWGIQGTGMRGGKAENLEKTARRKIQTARVQNRTARPARRFYACSRIGTLILLWIAEAPQHPSGDVPRN